MDLQSRFKLFDCEPPAEQTQHLDDVVKLARTTYMEYLFAQALLLYRNDAAGSEDEIKAQSKTMKAIKITLKDIQGGIWRAATAVLVGEHVVDAPASAQSGQGGPATAVNESGGS